MEKVVKKTPLSEVSKKLKELNEQLQELQKLEAALPFWTVFCLAVEFMGGFLDDKPLYADSQARSRFYLAFAKLFPQKYYDLNKKDYLYHNLRCMLVHRLLLTQQFVESGMNMELTADGKVNLNRNLALEEFKLASEKLMKRLENG